MVKKKESILFLLLLLFSIVLVYMYNDIKKTKNEIYYRLEKNEIEHISNIMSNIYNDIKSSYNLNDKDALLNIFRDEQTRAKYEQLISFHITDTIRYLYILYKDEQDKFRFLLDASMEDKANFYQKFDADNEAYMNAYKTKEPQIIKQKNMQNLYITYIYPLLNKDDEVLGVFSIDITTETQDMILSSIEPLENFFKILITIVLLLMFISLVEFFNYIMTRKKVFIDPLTHTFNRNYLNELLNMLNLKNYAVAMLDLDKFKLINDIYGHQAGDYVLVEVSKIFKNSIRDNDILIRYGGEEFLLLINLRENNSLALEVCDRIKKNISSHRFIYQNNEITISVSIGLHKYPSLEKDLDEAIKKADIVLYNAKKNGRNRIEIYDEKEQNTNSLLSKNLNFVKEALDEDRVICYFQPIYDYKKQEIVKYEALVRIVTKDGKIIPPFEFLPKIKGTNMHYKLTQRILHIVFEKIKESKKEISVNINFSDLINKDILNSIESYLSENSECAKKVSFEILESDEIENVSLFKEKTAILHKLGAKISIDDFGSGYSNFKTILDIEANYLKIDGSLIKNIDTNTKDYKVAKSIIHFAKQGGMQTIAEFVHSKEVFEKLQEIDVDFMQGYYIAPPKPTLIKESELF